MSKRINKLEERQAYDWEQIRELKRLENRMDKYVECKECGVLVRKDKVAIGSKVIIEEAHSWGRGSNCYTAELVYYCQHCKPKKKAKK